MTAKAIANILASWMRTVEDALESYAEDLKYWERIRERKEASTYHLAGCTSVYRTRITIARDHFKIEALEILKETILEAINDAEELADEPEAFFYLLEFIKETYTK